jgi:hypothetical protein
MDTTTPDPNPKTVLRSLADDIVAHVDHLEEVASGNNAPKSSARESVLDSVHRLLIELEGPKQTLKNMARSVA